MMQTIPIKYHNNIINKIIEKISFLDNVFVKRINLLASSDKLVSAHYRNNSFNELENIISNQTILKNSLFLKFFHKIFLDKGVVN